MSNRNYMSRCICIATAMLGNLILTGNGIADVIRYDAPNKNKNVTIIDSFPLWDMHKTEICRTLVLFIGGKIAWSRLTEPRKSEVLWESSSDAVAIMDAPDKANVRIVILVIDHEKASQRDVNFDDILAEAKKVVDSEKDIKHLSVCSVSKLRWVSPVLINGEMRYARSGKEVNIPFSINIVDGEELKAVPREHL